ncbi:hypothetical protein [Trichormus variabilis]|uniref:Uncharacterized protein n=1 Tax=Trichormus variabilis SAG 1403-4b TaxID=447716 RepID=A0A3S1A371_ANAVA|nr:hypothetical protein [Trichormus variabilis]MBD2629653.1 hypothetical protein [Trichormus variabilis FACHB-164]RUS92930.1 hypothetical protein DSM107003_46770 [Trichormus variabilis SAG 1403-4b]
MNNNNIDYLITILQQRAELFTKTNKNPDFLYKSVDSLVLAYGQPFTKQIKSPFKGEPKSCFKNCYQALYDFSKLNYCEGFAISNLGIPIIHAWLVNDNLEVIDPTWTGDRFQNCAYFGIVFTEDFVLEMTEKTEKYGILESDYLMDYQLQRQGFPPHALRTFNR